MSSDSSENKRKKILVLHISEFGGHKSASYNIKEVLERKDPTLDVVNINGFGYVYPRGERFINYLYTTTIKRFPQVWGRMYDRRDLIKVLTPVKRLVNLIAFRKFSKLIKKFEPDAIITTQAFPCGLAADYKKFHKLNIPLLAIVTDYHPHRFWIHPSVDAYIVASSDAEKTLIKEGVSKDRVKVFGIPISLKFLEKHDKRVVAVNQGFNPDIPSVLVMGGGTGFGPIKDVVLSLDKLKDDFQLIILCGGNKKLYNWFCRKQHKFSKPIFYFGFVDFVNQLMDFADIIVTKAGGITISESLTKELSIIVIDSIPGQEERNVTYLEKKGAVLKADTIEDVDRLVGRLLADKDERRIHKERAKQISIPDASLRVADLIIDLIK